MKEFTIELGHVRLAGLSQGDSNKPILLALHGWLDNAASFLPLAPYLDDFHVIAIDWPGHGHSQHRSDDASYQLTDYVYDLYVLSQYIESTYGHNRVHIVAHSLGGIVASIFAGAFPERLNKLVLIESFGPLVAAPQDCVGNLRKSIQMQYRNRDKRKGVHPSINSAVIARTNASDFSQDIAQLLVERSLAATDGGYMWVSDQRLRNLSPMRMTEPQAQNILAAITAPVLLVMGENGMDFPKDAMSKREGLLEGFSVAYFSGGHHVHMEQPADIAQRIVLFLTRD